MLEDIRYNSLKKIEEERNKYKVQCKCGTKTIIVNTDRTICRGCGHWVYRTKQIEFKEKMKCLMKG